jgi:hypothetical protein
MILADGGRYHCRQSLEGRCAFEGNVIYDKFCPLGFAGQLSYDLRTLWSTWSLSLNRGGFAKMRPQYLVQCLDMV